MVVEMDLPELDPEPEAWMLVALEEAVFTVEGTPSVADALRVLLV